MLNLIGRMVAGWIGKVNWYLRYGTMFALLHYSTLHRVKWNKDIPATDTIKFYGPNLLDYITLRCLLCNERKRERNIFSLILP